jgi:hypothetical protein
MNMAIKLSRRLLILSAAAGAGMAVGGLADVAAAQESPPAASSPAAPPAPAAVKTPPKSTAQQDAGEPRANTSPGAGSPAPTSPPTTSPGAGSTAAASPATGSPPAPPSRTAARGAAANSTPRPPGQKAPGTADRLDLSTATVTGEREQPKVMYIVPWKKSDIGDLSGKPMNSLLDEALAPVDRDEFKREVAYYGAVRGDATQNGAAKQGEK